MKRLLPGHLLTRFQLSAGDKRFNVHKSASKYLKYSLYFQNWLEAKVIIVLTSCTVHSCFWMLSASGPVVCQGTIQTQSPWEPICVPNSHWLVMQIWPWFLQPKHGKRWGTDLRCWYIKVMGFFCYLNEHYFIHIKSQKWYPKVFLFFLITGLWHWNNFNVSQQKLYSKSFKFSSVSNEMSTEASKLSSLHPE